MGKGGVVRVLAWRKNGYAVSQIDICTQYFNTYLPRSKSLCSVGLFIKLVHIKL